MIQEFDALAALAPSAPDWRAVLPDFAKIVSFCTFFDNTCY
jgi:hypothetical protein